MMAAPQAPAESFAWSTQLDATRVIGELLAGCTNCSAQLKWFGRRLFRETGTRLFDWVDHYRISRSDPLADQLAQAGFGETSLPESVSWRHPQAMLPAVVVEGDLPRAVAIKIDSVGEFLNANAWARDSVNDHFSALTDHGRLRTAKVATDGGVDMYVVERHGWGEMFAPTADSDDDVAAAAVHYDLFARRQRHFANDADGFQYASALTQAAADDIGIDWACDRFFAAERNYWQSRNRAAQLQKTRQDALGLGWANHDHHTYRSSREHFARLIAVFEQLGFTCRERFYAGREAGWGAQVLEQPQAGVVIFADVDLAPDEVTGDFAHEPLAERGELGTVGLWCKLHGESFLQAGMHHLECQFDFDAAREQLADQACPSMDPFTDFDYLKQCFTQGEMWPVDAARIDALLRDGLIDEQQAQRFREQGALGSHLEILQRDDGYKGFNQTGINDIIQRTDPRG